MIRDALMKSIRPRVDELAADLVDLISKRFEDQLGEALEAARSALASDLETPCRTQPASIPATDAPSSSSMESTSDAVQSAASGGARRRRPAACAVVPAPSTAPAASSHSATSTAAPPASAVARSGASGSHVCSNCGHPGHNARTCKREHLSTKPATTVAAAPTRRSTPAPASSPSPRPDRFAAIEEAAQRRAEKEKRSPRDPDDDDRPRRNDEPDLASDVGLPEPTFSIEL